MTTSVRIFEEASLMRSERATLSGLGLGLGAGLGFGVRVRVGVGG